jgi:hypothetical protein
MAHVLSAVPLHGLHAVHSAIEVALLAGRVNAEHVLSVLGHLKDRARPALASMIDTPLKLQTPLLANVLR